MSRMQRRNETAYQKCENRSMEVIRDPKIVDNLAVNGYIGSVVCQRTLDKEEVLTATIDRMDRLGEFDDRQPGPMGPNETYLLKRQFIPVFSEMLDCGDCPYTKTAPSPEVVEASAGMMDVMSRQLTIPGNPVS